MEKKRQKALAKESQEVTSRKRLGREKPAWRDDESDEEEEEEEEEKKKEKGLDRSAKELSPWRSKAKILSQPYVLPKSLSPDADVS